MQFAASHQAARDVGCLQRCALGRRMGGEIGGDRDDDVPALVGITPNGELPDPRLQQLIRIEASVFTQQARRSKRASVAISACGE